MILRSIRRLFAVHSGPFNALTTLGRVCTIHTGMKSADLVKLLEQAGLKLSRVRGSHHQFVKDGRTVTVPHPRKNLGIGLVKAIKKQACIS